MTAAARPEGLIHKANQIARFFAAQPERAAGAANHLKSFWDPQMRAEIVAWRAAGGDGLDPLAAEAVDLIAPHRPSSRPEARASGPQSRDPAAPSSKLLGPGSALQAVRDDGE